MDSFAGAAQWDIALLYRCVYCTHVLKLCSTYANATATGCSCNGTLCASCFLPADLQGCALQQTRYVAVTPRQQSLA